MLRIAINGFGRIGRTTFKAGFGRQDLEFVAVNDLMSPQVLAHLLKYDSVFRKWDHQVYYDEKHIIVDGKKIPVLALREPVKLPWKSLKVDVVIESTGRFTTKDQAGAHLTAGAKRVVVSAPVKETPTYLEGVNATKIKKGDVIINNASCTTNCISPCVAIMQAHFGVKKAMMSTVHAVTAEQNLVDGPPPALHPDLRRARSALVNIVPTSTGAARSTVEAIPELKGLFDGIAIRVPVLDVSLADFTFLLARKTTVEEVNETFRRATKNPLFKNIVGVTEEPLVSSDFIGSTYSAVVDLPMTRVVDGDLVKILAWYDNEWGYSYRLIEMVERVGKISLK